MSQPVRPEHERSVVTAKEQRFVTIVGGERQVQPKTKVMYEKDDFDHLRAEAGFTFALWLNFAKIPRDGERSIFFQWTEKAAFDIRVSVLNKMLTVLVRNERGVEA